MVYQYKLVLLLFISSTISGAQNDEAYIEKLYAGKSGYGIPHEESEIITNKGGAPTYGEITFSASAQLLNHLGLTKDDVVYDMGSGVGKFIIQTYLTTPVKKAVGIELSTSRIKAAQEVSNNLKIDGHIMPDRSLIFKEKDIAETNLSDATVVYMCSTCFSDELITKIAENAAKSKKNRVRIVTLKRLPPAVKKFTLKDTLTLKMTWSDNTTVYTYERTESGCKTK